MHPFTTGIPVLENSAVLRVMSVAVLLASLSPPGLAQNKSAAVWPDEGPRTWTPQRTTSDITANDLRTRLYQFADDSMQGRRIGELGNYKGTDYIAREFKRLGLKPAGDSGTYFQNLAYGPIGFDSTTSRLIAGGAPLARFVDWIPMAPNAGAGVGPAANINAAPVVFAGRWDDTTVALDPAVFRDKVAVFLDGPAPAAGGGGGGGGGRANTLPPRCDSVPDRFGAAAAVI